MTNIVDKFVEKKQAESQFLSLEDGETVVVTQLKDIKIVTKAGFGGEEKEVMRLKCAVQTSEGIRDKDFDNGTQRFAKEMQEKGITIGSAFTITREGLQTKTRYHIGAAAVEAPAAPAAAAEVAPTPAPETAPVAPVAEAPVAPEATTAPTAP